MGPFSSKFHPRSPGREIVMALSFGCPKCGADFRVAETMAGKKAKCPKCELVFVVPTPGPDGAPLKATLPEPEPVKRYGRSREEQVQAGTARTVARGRAVRIVLITVGWTMAAPERNVGRVWTYPTRRITSCDAPSWPRSPAAPC
jgi:predicted Zn finger-like uncharacterized protein